MSPSACGLFRTSCEISPAFGLRASTLNQIEQPVALADGLLLAFLKTRCHVFRAAVFSIVLAVATAPQATFLCQFLCQPNDSATSECHHHDQTATATRDKGCETAVLNVSTFVRDDSLRSTASGHPGHALGAVPRYQLARPTSELRAMQNAGRALTLERRPLETALRL